MNELTIDGKIYISSKKAAEITGYAKDYVGQLCREGHVEARMVGRSWYVLETSIRTHRFGGDPHAAPIEAAAEPVSVLDTWEKPTYVAETIPSMQIPVVQRAPEPVSAPDTFSTAETLTDMQAAWKEWFAQKQDTLIETPEIIDAREEAHEEELPLMNEEVARNIQAFKDAHRDIEESHHEEAAEPVSIQQVEAAHAQQYEEIEEESEPVLIHHTYEPQETVYRPSFVPDEQLQEVIPSKQERKQARARKGRSIRSGYIAPLILRALLIVLILVAFGITSIGTGYAARFTTGNPMLTPLFDFLGGTSTYSK